MDQLTETNGNHLINLIASSIRFKQEFKAVKYHDRVFICIDTDVIVSHSCISASVAIDVAINCVLTRHMCLYCHVVNLVPTSCLQKYSDITQKYLES